MKRLLFATALLLTGCPEGKDAPPPPPAVQDLPLSPFLVDGTVVGGGSLLVQVQGAALLDPRRAVITLEGVIDNVEPIEESFVATMEEGPGDTLTLRVSWFDLQALTATGTATFEGELRVVIEDQLDTLRGIGSIDSIQLELVEKLEPRVAFPQDFTVHLNQEVSLDARGILRPGEGESRVVLEGEFVTMAGNTVDVSAALPMRIGGTGRDEAIVHFPPDTFGLEPGTFRGRATAFNEHELSDLVAGSSVESVIEQAPTVLSGFAPAAGSRGEIVEVVGKGLIPSDIRNSRTMFILVEGTFRTQTGVVVELEGDTALRLAPDEVPSHDQARLVLRSEVLEQAGIPQLVGLTAAPGTFQGTMTPVLVDAVSTVMGEPWQGQFVIEPTRQLVYVKFLPGFSEALDNFGLANVEREIRDRIFTVLERDYDGVNIEFVETRPEGFAEYSIIEVGGADPNGADLLGLDNTAGKDTGNLRLDDIIGGENADSGELGYFVYGGVFVDSFRLFSPTISGENDLASPLFDQVFSPFMPELGGEGVAATEWPDGPRRDMIGEAARVLGNLIGNTISHEIGHSLGLAFFEEDLEGPTEMFHNDGDHRDAIMDTGVDRPFSERAELAGDGPQRFMEENRAYLLQVLPLP
jgi:hypothetical protein